MKLLVASILTICTTNVPHNTEEKTLDCFDKYVNCALTMDVIKSDKPEILALKRLNFCQYKTVK